MFTNEETRAVLAVAMSYDNRRPGDLAIAAWQTASDRARWTLGEAVNAIHEHYAVSREFVMPGDVTLLIRAERRIAPMPGERHIPVGPPASENRIRETVAAIAARLGWPERATSKTDPELMVACPHEPCRAAPGRPCGRRVARGAHQGEIRPLNGYHDSRRAAA
jgi:hypothetical protein